MAPADPPTPPARRVRFLCWDDYVDPACVAEFTAETGVGVETVMMASDDDCLHRVTSGEPFDVVLGTDYAAQVLIGRGLVRPLSLDRLPNWSLVTEARFREPAFDPGTGGVKYTSVNYWGTEGFAVRIDKVSHAVNSWKMLFDPAYAGQIAMLGGAREVFAPALYLLGSDCNCTDRALVAEATEMLMAQRPLVVSYDSSDVRSHLLDGTAIVHCWNGDAASALSHGIFQIAYLLPDEGFSVWMDAPFIPARAADPEAAHLLLDFLLRPDVAARNADFSGYMPVLPAADALVKSAVQRSLQPLESQAPRGVFQRDLGTFNDVYEEAFRRVLAS